MADKPKDHEDETSPAEDEHEDDCCDEEEEEPIENIIDEIFVEHRPEAVEGPPRYVQRELVPNWKKGVSLQLDDDYQFSARYTARAFQPAAIRVRVGWSRARLRDQRRIIELASMYEFMSAAVDALYDRVFDNQLNLCSSHLVDALFAARHERDIGLRPTAADVNRLVMASPLASPSPPADVVRILRLLQEAALGLCPCTGEDAECAKARFFALGAELQGFVATALTDGLQNVLHRAWTSYASFTRIMNHRATIRAFGLSCDTSSLATPARILGRSDVIGMTTSLRAAQGLFAGLAMPEDSTPCEVWEAVRDFALSAETSHVEVREISAAASAVQRRRS